MSLKLFSDRKLDYFGHICRRVRTRSIKATSFPYAMVALYPNPLEQDRTAGSSPAMTAARVLQAPDIGLGRGFGRRDTHLVG